MSTAPESLHCTPEPRLVFPHESETAGLLHLASTSAKDELDPPSAWAREWPRRFIARLCQTRDPATVELPDPETRAAYLAEAPPMLGAEYLSDPLLVRLWEELRVAIATEAADNLAGWLRERNPLWHLVGRVTFHLAENKRDRAHPVRLSRHLRRPALGAAAACSTRRSAGRCRSTPARRDQPALSRSSSRCSLAAEKSALVRGIVETPADSSTRSRGSPQDAYRFLREIPQLEESGLIVSVPDWWKANRPPRPASA